MISQPLLRQIPEALLSGVASGTYKVFGSVIRLAANGKVVGFLQETATTWVPVAMLANPATAPAGTAMLAAKIGHTMLKTDKGVDRIEQGVNRLEKGMKRVEDELGRIKGKLDQAGKSLDTIERGVRSLHDLGVANLAVSASGIGVSVAGFAMLAAKIEGLKQAVQKVAGQLIEVDRSLDKISQDAIDADLVELRALAKGLDEGWQLTDASRAAQQWHAIAQKALSLQTRFEWRAGRLLAAGPAHYALADPMIDAIAFASGLRVAALAACDEGAAAIDAAGDGARAVERLTGGIGLADLVAGALENSGALPGSDAWTLALSEANEAARPVLRRIREREAAVATRAAPLAALAERGLSTRDWLATARAEKDAPLLVMLIGDDLED